LREAFNDSAFLVVLELSGIEKSTKTPWTGFVLDMELIFVDHRHHLYIATGTVNLAQLIVFLTDVLITNINRFGSLNFLEVFLLQDIEPDPFTGGATVHFDILVSDRFKSGFTFWA
jgi:hypothetical protein